MVLRRKIVSYLKVGLRKMDQESIPRRSNYRKSKTGEKIVLQKPREESFKKEEGQEFQKLQKSQVELERRRSNF